MADEIVAVAGLITEEALRRGLLATKVKTPDKSMSVVFYEAAKKPETGIVQPARAGRDAGAPRLGEMDRGGEAHSYVVRV